MKGPIDGVNEAYKISVVLVPKRVVISGDPKADLVIVYVKRYFSSKLLTTFEVLPTFLRQLWSSSVRYNDSYVIFNDGCQLVCRNS